MSIHLNKNVQIKYYNIHQARLPMSRLMPSHDPACYMHCVCFSCQCEWAKGLSDINWSKTAENSPNTTHEKVTCQTSSRIRWGDRMCVLFFCGGNTAEVGGRTINVPPFDKSDRKDKWDRQNPFATLIGTFPEIAIVFDVRHREAYAQAFVAAEPYEHAYRCLVGNYPNRIWALNR